MNSKILQTIKQIRSPVESPVCCREKYPTRMTLSHSKGDSSLATTVKQTTQGLLLYESNREWRKALTVALRLMSNPNSSLWPLAPSSLFFCLPSYNEILQNNKEGNYKRHAIITGSWISVNQTCNHHNILLKQEHIEEPQ